MTHWMRRHPDATDLTVAVAFGVLVLVGTATLGAASTTVAARQNCR